MVGGVFSILPVFGLWMIPLGLLVLSVDFAIVRRWRRRAELWWAKRRAEKTKKR
jgi:cytochrome c-type biogenesis protein CcmH/NrfF